MENFRNTEELLAWVINFFAEEFGNNAIIRGGMALRLLNSPRYTNDIDYIFIPFRSKKDIKPLIEKKMSSVKGLDFAITLNSKALVVNICYLSQSCQAEISVENKCLSLPMSSSAIASQYGLPAKIVRIVELSTAFAHKIAAWNERELLRDLFDVYQYKTILKIEPNAEVLQKRLAKPRNYPNVKSARNLNELREKLLTAANGLNEQNIYDELSPLLPETELAGLHLRIAAAMRGTVENIDGG
ncbi:MAG: nucleotidyl transferase AbiEii/AbiGii toxin family protein [Chitinispirillales bacterium]|jgi:predicted nucleotidyltransferase component of viral defense system|nr:nucleotidyl transferase AbiEii/AbiGii toxin family protein [Chitinispirillales bacterium]